MALLPGVASAGGIDAVAHVVQVALTPVFLLSGVGTLLNTFNTRLARVSDHTEHLTELLAAAETEDDDDVRRNRAHLVRLRRRRAALDAAIILGAIGGASTCGSAFVLFLGGLRDDAIASGVVALLGAALACIVVSLIAFLADSILAWHGLRREGPMPRAKP